jgi:hypothetical protein
VEKLWITLITTEFRRSEYIIAHSFSIVINVILETMDNYIIIEINAS